MNYFLAIFSNRTESMDFANRLMQNRIAYTVISTPKDLGHSCGVSIKFNERDFNKVIRLFKVLRYMSFVGFYRAVFGPRGFVGYEREYVYL